MAEKSSSLDWLTIGQAAKYLGVSKDTLRRWEKRGKIKSYRTPGGRRRYTMYDLELAMEPQKTTPLIAHQIPRRKPQAVEEREEPPVKPSPIPRPLPEPTPEMTPKAAQPTKRFSTSIILLLTTLLILFSLFVFSGVGRLLLLRLKSSPEMLNPTPQTYFHSKFGSSLLILNYQEG